MIIGQPLMSVDNSGVRTYFGPWTTAEGNLAVMTCEVIASSNLQTFEVTVQTKNTEQTDKDAVTPAGGSLNNITISGTEVRTQFTVGAALSSTASVGFKELFRYKYVVTGDVGIGTGNGFVHFRMLNPSWLTN